MTGKAMREYLRAIEVRRSGGTADPARDRGRPPRPTTSRRCACWSRGADLSIRTAIDDFATPLEEALILGKLAAVEYLESLG